MCFHSYPAVRVRFEQGTYTVSEGAGDITICAVVDSILERDVNLTISISDDTATEGGVYMGVRMEECGVQGVELQCSNINIQMLSINQCT